MWLPDERKQSSKIYRSYLPTDAGYLSSYQRIPSVPRNSSYPPRRNILSSSRSFPSRNIRLETILLLTPREKVGWKIARCEKIVTICRFVASIKDWYRARKSTTTSNAVCFSTIRVFGGKRVRFSQFAPWPRKIAIGLGNTFTTGPGPVILLPKDFFFFFSLYTLSESLLFFFFFLSFGILVSGPFVPLIRFKRLLGPSIYSNRSNFSSRFSVIPTIIVARPIYSANRR